MTTRKAVSGAGTVRNSASGRFLVKQEAARARVVLDKKLGKTTPKEIVELARRTTSSL